jgi:hypothetical protein
MVSVTIFHLICADKKQVLKEEIRMQVTNIKIVKRTFEGVTDISKNDNPLTSKYYPSKKYALVYDQEGYEFNPVIECYVTKKDAEQANWELKESCNIK